MVRFVFPRNSDLRPRLLRDAWRSTSDSESAAFSLSSTTGGEVGECSREWGVFQSLWPFAAVSSIQPRTSGITTRSTASVAVNNRSHRKNGREPSRETRVRPCSSVETAKLRASLRYRRPPHPPVAPPANQPRRRAAPASECFFGPYRTPRNSWASGIIPDCLQAPGAAQLTSATRATGNRERGPLVRRS